MVDVIALVLAIGFTCLAAELVRAACHRQLLTPVDIQSPTIDAPAAVREPV